MLQLCFWGSHRPVVSAAGLPVAFMNSGTHVALPYSHEPFLWHPSSSEQAEVFPYCRPPFLFSSSHVQHKPSQVILLWNSTSTDNTCEEHKRYLDL